MAGLFCGFLLSPQACVNNNQITVLAVSNASNDRVSSIGLDPFSRTELDFNEHPLIATVQLDYLFHRSLIISSPRRYWQIAEHMPGDS